MQFIIVLNLKERLQEQERQKQEKRDESKRKREEKLKKINEVKQKKELELEQKRKEMDLQKQAPKITSSTSNNSIMHKSVLNNTTNTHTKPTLTKKPVEVSKPTIVVKKLSIVDQEFISDFANKYEKLNKLKQGQNP